MVYYDQKDSVWAAYPFNTPEHPIGKTGCGVTAMAITLSSLKADSITPIEMADYAIHNGFCEGYTKRPFFTQIINTPKYKLQLHHFTGGDKINEVKKLLSDGRHIAVAVMVTGHFTKDGHYIVLYGIHHLKGKDFLDVLDPNGLNDRYGTDGMIIKKQKGHVWAADHLFKNECEEYWVYSND